MSSGATFILRGRQYQLTAEEVERRLRDASPRAPGRYGVRVGARVFPAKQVLAEALGLRPADFSTQDAVRILGNIGLRATTAPAQPAGETDSERLFDRYMSNLGRLLEPQPKIQGTASVPGFRLAHSDGDVLFEVKEFAERPPLADGAGGAYDPHYLLRRQIRDAAKQVGDFGGYCRCLVLYDCGRPLVRLDPFFVFGAMAGGRDRATPGGVAEGLAAAVALTEIAVGQRRFAIAFAEREKNAGPLALDDYIEALEAAHGTDRDRGLVQIRAVAHEVPGAKHPLPHDLFRGPYDERYRLRPGGVPERTFVGRELEEIETQERRLRLGYHPVELPGEPLSEIIIRDRR